MSTRKILSLLQELLREIAREEIKDIIDVESYMKDYVKESKKNQSDRVKRELEDRGYILELAVYNKLKSREWDSSLQEVHWDIETNSEIPPYREFWDSIFDEGVEKKEREIDVFAKKTISLRDRNPLTFALIELVVECKKRTKEQWAFYVEQILDDNPLEDMRKNPPPYRYGEISSFKMIGDIRFRAKDPTIDLKEWGSEDFLKDLNNTSHQSILQMSNRALEGYTLFSGDDSIRKTCMKVLDAAIFQHTTHEAYEIMMKNVPPLKGYWTIYL